MKKEQLNKTLYILCGSVGLVDLNRWIEGTKMLAQIADNNISYQNWIRTRTESIGCTLHALKIYTSGNQMCIIKEYYDAWY